MAWKDEVEARLKTVEEEVESVVPRSYAARLKKFLDKLLPYSLMLLGSLITLNFFVDVSSSAAQYISILNWILISYFVVRLAAGFRLAQSDRKYLENHWFDVLLVIPAFSLVQELKILQIFEEIGIGETEAMTGAFASRKPA